MLVCREPPCGPRANYRAVGFRKRERGCDSLAVAANGCLRGLITLEQCGDQRAGFDVARCVYALGRR